MSFLTQKELERYRPTVTGIGWANTKQAAIYTGLAHRELCAFLDAGEIKFSRIGQKRRIRYAELDRFMAEHEAEAVDVAALIEGF